MDISIYVNFLKSGNNGYSTLELQLTHMSFDDNVLCVSILM
jgi:hypothetical protein